MREVRAVLIASALLCSLLLSTDMRTHAREHHAPVGLALEVENGAGVPLEVKAGQTFYVNQIDLRAALPASSDEGVDGLDRSGDFATLDWQGIRRDDLRAFEHSMAAGCPPIIEALGALAPSIFDQSRTRWLDVGGGDGTVAVGVLGNATVPRALRCDVFNLPSTASLVRDRASAAGLAQRVGFKGGDFFVDALPQGYDVLSFIRVLHDWPADVARRLLAAASDALPPGGKLIICEEFRNPDRLAVQFFWTYFLIGVDACASRLREVEWYTQALAELGFGEVAIVPGAFDVIVATRR